MKEIGGYFELELNCGNEYHKSALKLNLGRTAFEYILLAKNIKKVYMPYFICDVVLEPLNRNNIAIEFYHIDEKFEPVFDYSIIKDREYFLYVNYFGIKDDYIEHIAKSTRNLIIDNSQSFYSKPIPFIDTFYSPRKFFGLPDGGYLYTGENLNMEIETDNSSERLIHLVGRMEEGAKEYYHFYKKNELKHQGQKIKKMSKLTGRLLMNINYKEIAKKRKDNFEYLHKKIGLNNSLHLELTNTYVPMVYPYLSENKRLRKFLIKNKVYVPNYWPNVFNYVDKNSIEYIFTSYLIPLPIDQRYNQGDMVFISKLIK